MSDPHDHPADLDPDEHEATETGAWQINDNPDHPGEGTADDEGVDAGAGGQAWKINENTAGADD